MVAKRAINVYYSKYTYTMEKCNQQSMLLVSKSSTYIILLASLLFSSVFLTANPLQSGFTEIQDSSFQSSIPLNNFTSSSSLLSDTSTITDNINSTAYVESVGVSKFAESPTLDPSSSASFSAAAPEEMPEPLNPNQSAIEEAKEEPESLDEARADVFSLEKKTVTVFDRDDIIGIEAPEGDQTSNQSLSFLPSNQSLMTSEHPTISPQVAPRSSPTTDISTPIMGRNQHDSGNKVPPDPTIAVGLGHIVQM